MIMVKVCGITNIDDALLASETGVSALGFIFAPSPRQITPEKAKAIVRALPPFVKTVGVFVNEKIERIKGIRAECGIDLVQLHGDEPPSYCRELMPYSIKAFRFKNERELKDLEAYKGSVRAILLDTYQQGLSGGTGKIFDWTLAVKAKTTGIPLILAGGLNPENILDAVGVVEPYAVDVNSGIEAGPGKKSPQRMKALMERMGFVKG